MVGELSIAGYRSLDRWEAHGRLGRTFILDYGAWTGMSLSWHEFELINHASLVPSQSVALMHRIYLENSSQEPRHIAS